MLCRPLRRKSRLLRINIILFCVFLVLLIYDALLGTYTAKHVTFNQELNYTSAKTHQSQRLFALFWGNRERVNTRHALEQTQKITYKHHSGICNVSREKLKGREEVHTQVLLFSELEQLFPGHHGGRFRPSHCQPSTRIAIIIPYRNREFHLKRLLLNLIPKLRRQLVDFTIYVIEQANEEAFNRGMMRNIGYLEAKKRFAYDCYVFNDVDTIIEDDRNLFKCGTHAARHLVSGVRRYNYSLPYRGLLGGIVAMTEKQMTALNGYSNMFFVWGGEDDNLYDRFVETNFWFERTDYQDGLVTTLTHRKDKKTISRFRTIGKTKHSMLFDGISSVRYKVLYEEYKLLFTWIVVSVNKFLTEEEFELNVANTKQRQSS